MPSVTPVNNYLVPATGTTNSVPVVGTFSAVPTRVDFREISLNGEQFVPSGVFIDNSAGIGPLIIEIESMQGYSVYCPAGQIIARQYPAPIDQIVNIVGNGDAVVIFVDFPVIPSTDSTSGAVSTAVTIADGADATFGAQADAAAANDTGAFSFMALFKRLQTKTASLGSALMAASTPVTIATNDTQFTNLLARLPAAPASSTIANVAITLASQIALATNPGRLGAIFTNDSTTTVHLLLVPVGPAAANTCSVILAAGGSFVLNKGDYTGNVHAIGAAATGTLRVTEFTA